MLVFNGCLLASGSVGVRYPDVEMVWLLGAGD